MLQIWARIRKLLRGQDKTPPGVKVVIPPRPPGDPMDPKGTKLVLQQCTGQLPTAQM